MPGHLPDPRCRLTIFALPDFWGGRFLWFGDDDEIGETEGKAGFQFDFGFLEWFLGSGEDFGDFTDQEISRKFFRGESKDGIVEDDLVFAGEIDDLRSPGVESIETRLTLLSVDAETGNRFRVQRSDVDYGRRDRFDKAQKDRAGNHGLFGFYRVCVLAGGGDDGFTNTDNSDRNDFRVERRSFFEGALVCNGVFEILVFAKE